MVRKNNLKPYYIEVFRINKFFPKSLIKVLLDDPTGVTAIDVKMDNSYILKIQMLDSYGRKVSVSDVVSKSKIIHGGGIILDIDAPEKDQFIEPITFEPIVPPKENILQPHDKEEKSTLNSQKNVETSLAPRENDDLTKKDDSSDLNSLIKAKKSKIRKYPKKGSGNAIMSLYKNGRPIPHNSVINAKLYCLTPEIFLNADIEGMYKRLEFMDIKNEIGKVKAHYQEVITRHDESNKILQEDLIKENQALKLENDQLRLGKTSLTALHRFKKLFMERDGLLTRNPSGKNPLNH